MTSFVALTYHSVRNDQRPNFARQMDVLIQTGQAVSADFSETLKNKRYYIAVTFDDGYHNILLNALPEMFRRGIPATIFVTTGYLGKKPAWIKDIKNPNIHELVLSEDQLKNLPRKLVTIGSHTDTHPNPNKIDMKTLEREITVSKNKLEEMLHEKVTLLSLPYGSIENENVKCFQQAGYSRIFLNIPTFPATLAGRYFVGRIEATPDDWMIEYKLKLRGAYQWLPWAVAGKRIVKNFVWKTSPEREVYS